MKMAIIFSGNLGDRKGMINAVLSRAKYLKEAAPDWTIDIFNFCSYKGRILSLLTHRSLRPRPSSMIIDGMIVNLHWHRFSVVNYILSMRLKTKPFHRKLPNSILSGFRQYDLISAHSLSAARIAREIQSYCGIPFFVTWHGSDIHTYPIINMHIRQETESYLQEAACNFFVCESLRKSAERITTQMNSCILYNGVSEAFYRYPEIKRNQLRKVYGVDDVKVVCFAGNLIDVKNPLSLVSIFDYVSHEFAGRVAFWLIGDGNLRGKLEEIMNEKELNCFFWGNQPSGKMPDFLNCVDVLVLPSKNEGLPLILGEALSCGASAVASDVGGNSEVLDNKYVFKLGPLFERQIADKIVELLASPLPQLLDAKFSWTYTAHKELEVYREYCRCHSNSKV